TAVSGSPSGTTDGSGDTGSVTITAVRTTGNAMTVSASFAGNTLYSSATSNAASIDIEKHITALGTPSLTAPLVSNIDSGPAVPWGHTFNATSTLTDEDDGSSTIAGETIAYSGTAVSGSPSGTGSVTIIAPGDGTGAISTVGTGHTVSANFAGNALYEAATSPNATIDIKNHATSISLDIGGVTSVKWGKTFKASATLTDSDDNAPIQGKVLSFTGS